MRVFESFQRALLPLAVTLAIAGCARGQVKTMAPAAPASPAVATQDGGGMAQAMKARADYIKAHYDKAEIDIPMRDGAKLHTVVYTPKDAGPGRTYPILMQRTPYSCAPYGADKIAPRLGQTEDFEKDGFIFACQDVRGKFLSEGEYVNMRPVRFAPWAAGANPTTTTRAAGSPKPGTGRAQ